MSYIGDKKIKEVKTLEEKTPAGIDLIEVEYINGKKEVLSKTMYDAIVNEKSCDATTLRDRRVHPVVGSVLAIMREWGIKIGETAYFSALLNQSLNSNKDAAEVKLWKKVSPTIESSDDVDLIAVDRILKMDDKSIPSTYYGNESNGKKE